MSVGLAVIYSVLHLGWQRLRAFGPRRATLPRIAAQRPALAGSGRDLI